MSVFTPLSTAEIEQFLNRFDAGSLVRAEGIPGGSENTNYFVDSTSGNFVLTLVERGDSTDLPFVVRLLNCLQSAGVPVPYAIKDRQGIELQELKDKPALLQPRLSGQHIEQVSAEHCAQTGELLAKLHGASCELQRVNDRGPQWVLQEALSLLNKDWRQERSWLEPALLQLREWLELSGDDSPDHVLPTAVIHGDLFRDNVLFDEGRISGVIDFYNAATGWTLFDIAICINDWCIDAGTDGALTMAEERCSALLNAYARARPFSSAEQQCWPMVLQLAALRFWISRHHYAAVLKDQDGILIKDPGHFRSIMQMHVSKTSQHPLP